MMKSIRNRILRNFLIVIISTIFILDISTIICLKAYYYKNTAKTLENGIDSSINFYNRYFSSKELIENVYDNIDAFWDNSKNQVEILDENGQLLMDSFGIRDEKILNTDYFRFHTNDNKSTIRISMKDFKNKLIPYLKHSVNIL